jgi:hypothetical protein
MSAEPSWSPWSRTVSLCSDVSDSGNHSVLLRPVNAARSSALLGEYDGTFNADRSGVFQEGVVNRRWLEDEDAWTLARYICSAHMQREASAGFTKFRFINSTPPV